MPTFDTPRPITANIQVAAGSVRLIASERADTVVEVRPRDASRPADVKASDDALVDFTNGTLRVVVHRRAIWGRGAVAVTVELPSRSVLRAAVASATLTADGQLGDCRVDSASGSIDLDATAACKINTASGHVTVAGVTGAVKVNTASGNVTLRSVEGAVVVATASGHAEIGDLSGDLKATTASGDVTVGAAAHGSLKAATASGDVTIGIPEGTAAHLTLKTRSGAVENRLQSADGPAEADRTLTVRAQTASGDITVQRCATVAESC